VTREHRHSWTSLNREACRRWQLHKPLTSSVWLTELSKQRESYLLSNKMENVTRLHRQGFPICPHKHIQCSIIMLTVGLYKTTTKTWWSHITKYI